MKLLVIAEHDNQCLKTSTLHAVSAATQLSEDIVVLIAGYQCNTVAEQAATIQGVREVMLVDAACLAEQLAEPMAALLHELSHAYEGVMAAATTFGKNIMPRAAALCDVAQISDVTEIVAADTFVRPIYAGNALATVKSLDAKKFITFRPTAFAKAGFTESAVGITTYAFNYDNQLSQFIDRQLTQSDRPELGEATTVVSGGRGLQSGENFALLEQLADKLNAAVGASRAAVDAGFVANDYQVGQTGKVVAPNLYIAVGISGAIQHIAGMKDSKVIVAINKDEDAPIFQIADYGLVGDLFTIVPELIEKL